MEDSVINTRITELGTKIKVLTENETKELKEANDLFEELYEFPKQQRIRYNSMAEEINRLKMNNQKIRKCNEHFQKSKQIGMEIKEYDQEVRRLRIELNATLQNNSGNAGGKAVPSSPKFESAFTRHDAKMSSEDETLNVSPSQNLLETHNAINADSDNSTVERSDTEKAGVVLLENSDTEKYDVISEENHVMQAQVQTTPVDTLYATQRGLAIMAKKTLKSFEVKNRVRVNKPRLRVYKEKRNKPSAQLSKNKHVKRLVHKAWSTTNHVTRLKLKKGANYMGDVIPITYECWSSPVETLESRMARGWHNAKNKEPNNGCEKNGCWMNVETIGL